MKLQFLNSSPLGVISGGNIYNKAVIEGLRQQNIEIDYNTVPLEKDYDISIVDSLYMSEIDFKKLNLEKPIIALIHQIPELNDKSISFYKTHAKFIVTGEITKLELIKLWQINDTNIRIIRPGVPKHWKAKTEFKNVPNRVTIISNFIANKGFELLLNILKCFNHLEFHIIGNDNLDKPYAEKIIKSINETKSNINLYFNLSRDDVYDQLIKSDIFLSLSKSESFGMSLFEALSLGIPSIAYRTGDFNYFNRFQNYVEISDYSEDRFINIINKWVNNSIDYKSYINTTSLDRRHWDHVVNEFSTYLKQNVIVC